MLFIHPHRKPCLQLVCTKFDAKFGGESIFMFETKLSVGRLFGWMELQLIVEIQDALSLCGICVKK